jgi:hypothetical protein
MVWERFQNKMAVSLPQAEVKEPVSTEEKLADAITLLTKTLEDKEEQKAAGNVHSAMTLHDGGGIFSTPGLDRTVITAHIRPMGIGSSLPLLPSIDADPRFASITGFSGEYGARVTNACDDAPTGYMKGCNLTALFGLERQDTETIEMDRVMLRWNRGDFRDLMLRGQLLGLSGLTPQGMNQQDVLNVITKAEMVSAAVRAERQLVRQMWQGNILLSEFPGLDAQIATGQVDADTNTACSALDSDVKDFGYDDVCGTGRDIVEYLSMLVWYLEYNAMHMGLDPASFVIVMRPELWYELSACWPCRYMTNRCANAAGTAVGVINDENNVNLRDGMRNGLYIDINGKRYPVIVDHGIFEHNSTNNANLNAGEFASSIYVVPMTIQGGFPVTYREYLDYRGAAADVALLDNRHDFWTDDGIYSWAIENQKWCYKLALKTEQRVILRTPQLAGKIQYVRYTPLQHLRDPQATSSYFQDGGVSVRSGGTRYAVWAASGIGGQ